MIETSTKTIEDTFKRFTKAPNISIILINQHVRIFKLKNLIKLDC